jgi:archaellum component FlaC
VLARPPVWRKSHTSAHHTREFSSYACQVSVMENDWTDKRMDDFADRVDRFEANVDRRFDKVDERFDKVDERFDRFEADVDRRFDKVDEDIKAASARSDAQFEALGTKIDRLSYRMWTPWIAIAGVLIAKIIFGWI